MTEAILESTFVPADLDCSDFANLQPYYDQLAARPVDTLADLEQWLIDFSDLTAVVSERRSRLYIDHSCRMDDADREAAYMHYVEHIAPKIQPLVFKLQKKCLDSPACAQLEVSDERYRILLREWRTEVGLYRDENIPRFTEVTKLSNNYGKIRGSIAVTYRDQEYTLPQLGKFMEQTDRSVREEVFRLSEAEQFKHRDTIDDIFDKLIALRSTIASEAGEPDYRSYAWKSYSRFDYTPQHCHDFADAVEQCCMPLVTAMDERRLTNLKLDRLRPWDLSVDPFGRPPLQPFDASDVDSFVSTTRQIIDAIAPELGTDFESLRATGCLDLDSRKAKRPGGFQASLEASRRPFIFMNAAGLQRDVETLLHEAGHAFHTLAARTEPLAFLRHAPMEFCEVASMSMELLADDHLGAFYNDDEAARAKRIHLEGIIRLLPWIATIDQFQHWLYTHPDHTRDQRTSAWLRISGRFSSPLVDWTGFEDIRATRWHKQLHLFSYPFYYIEYGIAQLGALQVWLNWKQDPDAAVRAYRAALALGGTRPLPTLFETARIKFDFSAATVAPLMQAIGQELASLPD